MTTCTRPAGAPAYYLSRPAALWLAALGPRPTTHTPPGASCASGAPPAAGQTADFTRTSRRSA